MTEDHQPCVSLELTDRQFVAQCPRAFVVSDDENAVVVYARNVAAARSSGHGLEDIGHDVRWIDLEVRRAPEFDNLGGKTLREVQLAHGWQFDCESGKGCPMAGLSNGAVIVDGDVYCSRECAETE